MPRSSRDNDDDNSDNEDLPEDYFEVESIVDGRRHRGRWQFLVKWVGYTDKDNSWVFEDDFGDNCLDMIREFKSNRQPSSRKSPARPEKTATITTKRRKRSRRSMSSSSLSNDQTDSLSDDNLPLTHRLRGRKAPASSLSAAYSEKALAAAAPDDEEESQALSAPPSPPSPPPSNERLVMRMDSETSVNSNQTEVITDDDHGEEAPPPPAVLAPAAPVVAVADSTAEIVSEAAADVVVVPVPEPEPAPVIEAEAVAAVPPQAAQRTSPEPAEARDPNADLLGGSVFCRKLAPEGRFPKSVSEICNMMGSLDERGRIELIDHLTFRVGYAEMFALISTQRPFLSIFERWLLNAYRGGTPLCIAFIRSALTLMSVFPGSKVANYRRLIKVIREWFVVDPVCMNLSERVLKQWQYHKEISHGKSSTSQLPSPIETPTGRSANEEVLSPPEAAAAVVLAPSAVPVAAVEPTPLPRATEAGNAEPGDFEMDIAVPDEAPFPSAVSTVGADAVTVGSDAVPVDVVSTQPGAAAAESTLNQVEVEQDDTITYMPAGLDDDLDYPSDDGSEWMTVSIS